MSDDTGDLVATASATVGPFFHFGLATDATLGCVAGPSVKGTHITLRIRLTDGDGAPVPDGLIEVWQVDADGAAAATPALAPGSGFSGFGRLPTSVDGTCEFQTIVPGRVADGQGGRQAPHINICLFARGLLRQVHTRVYFAGDPALTEDVVLALVPEARRPTLLAQPDPDQPGRWVFDLCLQGDREAVFFAV